jgi:cell division protein FtsB
VKTLRAIGRFLINRYVITFLAFAVWMIFFDNNSLKRQHAFNERVSEIKRMKAYYQAEIAKNNKAIDDLLHNPEALEKYAREKYMMKRDSEDVYLIVRE